MILDDKDKPNNVFKFGSLEGGKGSSEEDNLIPHNDYVVIDIDDNEFDAKGFLIFTQHHIAIMADDGKGAIPALVMPISRVKAAMLAELINEE